MKLKKFLALAFLLVLLPITASAAEKQHGFWTQGDGKMKMHSESPAGNSIFTECYYWKSGSWYFMESMGGGHMLRREDAAPSTSLAYMTGSGGVADHKEIQGVLALVIDALGATSPQTLWSNLDCDDYLQCLDLEDWLGAITLPQELLELELSVYGYDNKDWDVAKIDWGRALNAEAVATDLDTERLAFLVALYGKEDLAAKMEEEGWTIPLTEEEQTQAAAQKQFKESFANDPGTYNDSYDNAVWAAKAHATSDILPNVNPDPAWETALSYGSGLEKLQIYSLYHLNDSWESGTFTDPITSDNGTQAPGIDADAAAYALQYYNKMCGDNPNMSLWERMQLMPYKLKATMALASGTLAADENFITNAYGASSFSYEEGNMTFIPTLYSVSSPRLGTAYINPEYYFYLIKCYNEFAHYGRTLVHSLGTACNGEVSFKQYRKQIESLKALYEAMTWATDSGLNEIWKEGDAQDQDQDLKATLGTFTNLAAIYEHLAYKGALDTPSGFDYAADTVESPLRYFFGTPEDGSWQLSDNVRKGIAISSAYIPMQTNLYDPWVYDDLIDTEWLVNFHSKFGYNRKALYIDTNADAAVSYYNTNTRGDLRVCTLEDLLAADRDIVLYLDDNLYNVKTLAELTDKAFDRLDNVDGKSSSLSWFGKIKKAIVSLWDVSIENISKTAEYTTYSSRVKKNSTKQAWKDFFLSIEMGEELEELEEAEEDMFDDYSDYASYYLQPDDLWDADTQTVSVDDKEASSYTVLTAFAVLSTVYNDTDLFNDLNASCGSTPVFISSPTLAYLDNVSGVYLSSIYNYMLLMNLDAQMSIDYANNLDMTSPVYMDIYGNIVTESGLVVVPAASNTTLWNSNYSPYNTGFLSTYGDSFLLEANEDDPAPLKDLFEDVLQSREGYWQLHSLKVSGGSVDLSRLSIADKQVLASVTDVFWSDLGLTNAYRIYDKNIWEMIITEGLRGAPLEHIDKDFEGLNLDHRTTKQGLVVAQKLEYLVEALSSHGANTTLTIPNPAYMDGIEYIVFFAFKALILGILVIWMVTVYLDAVGGGIHLRTFGKCIAAVVLVISLIVGVPAAFELSYYQSNKLLLQDETEYLMMLNLEKKESGHEIGITSVHVPESSSTLYLKLADVDIPWYDLLYEIAINPSVDCLQDLYANYEGQHPLANAKGVTVVNDGIYISTDQLFESSTITFTSTYKQLFQVADTGDTPASYYTPYYYFLDQILSQINGWTKDAGMYAYSTKVQRGGKLKTLGYIRPYFTSEYFMEEGMDYFALYRLYDVTAPMTYEYQLSTGYSAGSDPYVEARNSQWCSNTMSDTTVIKRIEKLNDYARMWVAEHKELIGKVTDETFLKCFALSCAIEHNRLFNTLRADSLEIYELSNEDLLRLSITDSDTVMRSSSMSYARFVYNVGGIPAVYAAAFLTLVNFVCSWVKPLATLAVFAITCISIFVCKLILRRGNNSIYGYICTILLMCGINFLGSVFIKLTMFIPNTGLSPTVCILLQIVVQILYMGCLLWVISTALKDWRNMGFEQYNSVFNNVVARFSHERSRSTDVHTPKQKDGWDYYNILTKRQERRRKSL